MIEKLLDKMGTYNVFTNIIPGYMFIIFNMFYFDFKINNILQQIVLAYFLGLTISRIGSITIGNVLIKFSKEQGEPYNKYIEACNNDSKIELLLQERNSFRTFCSLFIICFIEIICNFLISKFKISKMLCTIIILIILFGIYSISYCKYNKYISKRIRINNKK